MAVARAAPVAAIMRVPVAAITTTAGLGRPGIGLVVLTVVVVDVHRRGPGPPPLPFSFPLAMARGPILLLPSVVPLFPPSIAPLAIAITH